MSTRNLTPSSTVLGSATCGLLGTAEAAHAAHGQFGPTGPDAVSGYSRLRAFFAQARTAGVRVGGVFFPAPDALGRRGASYPFDYLHVGVQRVCTEEGVHCLDLLPLYSEFEDARKLWVSPFDAHPNALVSRLAAERIASAFKSSWEHARTAGSAPPSASAAATSTAKPGR